MAVLIAVIAITAYAFYKPTVTLPPFLDRCIPLSGPYIYRSTPQLVITIDGVNQTIPANIGIGGSCVRPIFTLTPSGVIHIFTDENRTYTLGDFFLVWGNTYGPNYAMFNGNRIFGHTTDATHGLIMTVNNQTDNTFQNYPFPRDANTTEKPYVIRIVYG